MPKMRKRPRIKKTQSERRRIKPFSQRSMVRRSLLLCSSTEFQRQRVTLIRFIASFFFCLQCFGILDGKKLRRLMTVKIKKIDRVSPRFGRVDRVLGWPAGSTWFPRANSWAGFCLNPDWSQARVGQVPGRPAGPVRVLKHCLWCLSLGLGLVGV